MLLGACGDSTSTRPDTDDTDDTDTPDTTDTDTDMPEVPSETSFERLVARYDVLWTLAGKGAVRDQGNEWSATYEGGPATQAELSRPHTAMADSLGRVFITDKEAHAIRRVDPDGRIFTVAGTGIPGDDGDGPALATAMRLTDPNGLHITANDIVFILDQGNGKVRRLGGDTMSTFITIAEGIAVGRGLWVSDDEQEAFIAAGDKVLRWRSGQGLSLFASGFVELGNLTVDTSGALVVTDRMGHSVYRLSASGSRTRIAGNGTTTGGGDGALATNTGLEEPRAIAFTDDGGFFVGTHEGNQLWWVAPEGTIHLFLDGGDNHAHSGDGRYFRSPGKKVSEVRAVSLDRAGNVLVVENDFGYVRKVALRE
jgi:hypothetical protein